MEKKILLLSLSSLLAFSCGSHLPKDKFKVTFYANNGDVSFSDGNKQLELYTKKNEPLIYVPEVPRYPQDFENEKFFCGWAYDEEGDNKFNINDPITGDVDLYARWEDIPEEMEDNDNDGLYKGIDPNDDDNKYIARLNEAYVPIFDVSMPFEVDYQKMATSNVYDDNLAKLFCITAIDIYIVSYTQLVGESSLYTPRNNWDYDALYRQLGCLNVEHHTLNPDLYNEDKGDTYICELAHHPASIEINGTKEKYEFLYVTNQGTASEDEWCNDFDVGSEDEGYKHCTGDHPDWQYKNHHKGFDVAVNRELDLINEYIGEHIDKTANLVILNSGHSRGAAMANILAAHFNNKLNKTKFDYEDKVTKCLTYTYATPETVIPEGGANENVECPNTFNILNEYIDDEGNKCGDLVPKLPLEKWGFHRYGVDVTLLQNIDNEKWMKFHNADVFEYNAPDCPGLVNSFGDLAGTRDELYKEHKTDDCKFTDESYVTEILRDKSRSDWLEAAKVYNAENTLDFDTEDVLASHTLVGYNRPVTFMKHLAVMIGTLDLAKRAKIAVDGTLCPKYKELEIYFIENALDLLTAHRGSTYYFIVDQVKPGLAKEAK